jgi:MFS family permease
MSLRHNRDFANLWAGQVISSLGGGMASTSLILVLLAQTRSPTITGLAGSVFMAGFIGSNLLAGWLGHRYQRRGVLQACNLVAAVACAALVACLIAGHLVLIVAIGTALIEGITTGIFAVTEAAAMPFIVSSEDLPRALVLNQARGYAARLAGPPLGGLLLGIGRVIPFAANAISYLVSVALLRRIRSPLRQSGEQARAAERSVTLVTGWRNIRGIPFVRVSSCFVACSDFLVNATTWVIIMLTVSTGSGPAQVGVVLACGGIGGLGGALAASRLHLSHSWLPAFMLVVPLVTAGLLTLAAVSRGVTIGLPYALIFAAWPLWQGMVIARVMELVPDAERGHTLAVGRLLTAAPSLLAPPVAGLLVTSLGPRAACLALAAGMAALALAAALPAVRRATATHQSAPREGPPPGRPAGRDVAGTRS